MSAPSFVPGNPTAKKAYRSPSRTRGTWSADRPGDVIGTAQPAGPALGNQGPDQGYVLKLAERFRGDLQLKPGEHASDALTGCCAVALRRASLYGRAPVSGDLEIALRIFGYLDDAPADLVTLRREKFAEVHHETIHYFAAREIADMVPESTLRMSPAEVASAHAADWKRPLGLDG